MTDNTQSATQQGGNAADHHRGEVAMNAPGDGARPEQAVVTAPVTYENVVRKKRTKT